MSTSVVPHEPVRPLHKGGVDLSTGVYVREDDDLVVNTPMPMVLRRTYNSGDGFSRQFGMNATHAGEWWLFGDGDPRVPWAELILPNGGRIHFTRTSPGNTQEGAVLRHTGTPTPFGGALLSWSGSLWELRMRDGSMASFLDCQTKEEICSVVERRDPDGHGIQYVRDASIRLLRMESEGQSISFTYDDHKRIVRASDTSNRSVSYEYDQGGRLVKAVGPGDVLRSYEYDDHDKLIAVREPGRIVYNRFDEQGRWNWQMVKRSESDDDPDVASARYVVEDGSIIESDLIEGGSLEVIRYNKDHYIVLDTLYADSPAPVTFTYDRDPLSNAITGVTLSCLGPAGPVRQAVPFDSATNDRVKNTSISNACRPPR